MKHIFNKYGALLLVFLTLIACQEEEPSLSSLVTPTNLNITTAIEDDQSGNVTVTASAENALSIQVIFRQNANPVAVSPGQPAKFRYTQSGQYSQQITVVAYGAGGTATSKNIIIDLDVRLLIDQDILNKIGGDGTKRWVWNSNEPGHFGADSPNNQTNGGFSATPNQLNPCMYDDVLVFSYDENDTYGYQLETGLNNETFITGGEVDRFFPGSGGNGDTCGDITDQIATNTSFLIFTGEDGQLYLQVENSTLSYWSGATEYRILELTDDILSVRGVSTPGGGGGVAWYHVFRPEGFGS